MTFSPFACTPFTTIYPGATLVKNTDGSYTLSSPSSPNTAYNTYSAGLTFENNECGTLDVIARSGGGDVGTPVYIASISRCGASRLTLTNGDAIAYLDSVANTTFIFSFYIRQSAAFTITFNLKDVQIPYNRAAAAQRAIEISRADFQGTFFQFGTGNLTWSAAGRWAVSFPIRQRFSIM
jgi:hypothetical protein